MSTYATDAKTSTPTSKAALLEKARKCFKQACEAEAKQRDREREDLRFQIPELQWDETARNQRMGGNIGGGVVTPPRPILSISKLDQPIQLVLNQARAAHLGVNIHPISEKANDETAEVMQGIYRRIERDSNANQARLWALDRATKSGRGAYLITTTYDEDAPETWDQEIRIERILHQDMVYFDPNAQKPDFSDGEWAFMVSWLAIDTFKRLYPKAKAAQAAQAQDRLSWEGLNIEAPGWMRGEGQNAEVLVANYWYKKHDTETIEGDDRSRTRDKVRVCLAKLTGHDVLADEETDGQYIPLIPVIGRELQPVDSERHWVGMIRPTRDGQKLYNYAAATLVEDMATEPKVPYVGAEGQFEGHEGKWQQANVRNFPYLEYKPVSLGGQQAPPPQRMQIDTSKMQLAMMALKEADSFIQATTSVYDPSLGKLTGQEKSGRQVLALQSQSDAGTSHYLASLADVSLAYEARVILDLIPHIYDRPGRITKIVYGEEDKDKTVMLNAPFVIDPQTKRPMRVPTNGAPNPQGAKQYNLAEGRYGISVDIGKGFQTRLQEGQEVWSQMLPGLPPEAQLLLLPTLMRFMDSPGHTEAAELLTKFRDAKFPGLADDKDGAPTTEQLQSQLAAMGQQFQLVQSQLQQAMEMIKTDRAKQEAMILKAQLDAKTKLQLQQMGDAKDMQIARLNAQVKGGTMAQEAHDEQIVKGEDHAFEFDQNEKDRELERELAHFDAAHEVGMAAAGGSTVKRTREGGQEQENEQGQETSSGRSSATAPRQEGEN